MLLGELSQGISAKKAVSVHNPGLHTLTVERVDTSCPCLTATPVPMKIGPGETRTLNVNFDPVAEPDYHGALSIEAVGYDRSDRTIFRTHVKLVVRHEAAKK